MMFHGNRNRLMDYFWNVHKKNFPREKWEIDIPVLLDSTSNKNDHSCCTSSTCSSAALPWNRGTANVKLWALRQINRGRFSKPHQPETPINHRCFSFQNENVGRFGGGLNPVEKYVRQIGSFPHLRVKIRDLWNHHLVQSSNHQKKRLF